MGTSPYEEGFVPITHRATVQSALENLILMGINKEVFSKYAPVSGRLLYDFTKLTHRMRLK